MLVYTKMVKREDKKNIYFVIGPTSSGKTALSVELAKKLGDSEIICADSRQIYKDLNIGSGKVTVEEMEGVPHHLLDVATPGEKFSVVEYTMLALEKIEEIYERGNIPIVSGGTGFYIDSLLYEYNLPEVQKDDVLRVDLESKNTDELKNEFNELVKNIPKTTYLEQFQTKEFYNNKNRIMRAIELIKHFGYIPEIKKVERFPSDKYNVHIIKTKVSRADLKDRIYKRTVQRLNDGMLEEFTKIVEKYNLNEKYVIAWGYEFSLMWNLLNNKIDRETFLTQFVTREYQYAKRQDTWFKRYKTTE